MLLPGRLTGTAGVALSTLGPGATNLTTASAYAFLGAFPMLIITGQKPVLKSKQVWASCGSALLSCIPCLPSPDDQTPQDFDVGCVVDMQGAFQIVDSTVMFQPITKWAKQVRCAPSAPWLPDEHAVSPSLAKFPSTCTALWLLFCVQSCRRWRIAVHENIRE